MQEVRTTDRLIMPLAIGNKGIYIEMTHFVRSKSYPISLRNNKGPWCIKGYIFTWMTDDTRKLIGINKLLSLLETLKNQRNLGVLLKYVRH
jgi:hypothetical protein